MGGSESHESNDPFFNFLSPRRLSRGTFLPSLIMELLPSGTLASAPSFLAVEATDEVSISVPPACLHHHRTRSGLLHELSMGIGTIGTRITRC